MAEYKGIKGFKVQSLGSDPTNNSGEIWYNTATNLLKYTNYVGAWSSGTAVNTGRASGVGGAGTMTSALIFGGNTLPPPGITNITESWNGTTWTEVADLNQSKDHLTGYGATNTSAMCVGGHTTIPPGNQPAITSSETFNGSTWSEGADLPVARSYGSGTGITTAGLYVSGIGLPPLSPQYTAETYEYDGSTWTESNNVGTASYDGGAIGTQTAALYFGGRIESGPTDTAISTEYNGTAWTVGNSLTIAKKGYNMCSGITTQALQFGGAEPGDAESATVMSYDGTSWSTSSSLATGRGGGASAHQVANNTTAKCITGTAVPGGLTSTTAVEDWGFAYNNKTVTVT